VAEETTVVETKASKHKLPEGIMTPVEAYHKLKKEGLAGSNLTSQLVYTKLNAAKKNGFPVKHYDAEGVAHDEPIEVDDKKTTRPGIVWEELAEWWPNQPTRAKKTESENGDKKEAEGKHERPEVEDDDDEAEILEDEDLVEAE